MWQSIFGNSLPGIFDMGNNFIAFLFEKNSYASTRLRIGNRVCQKITEHLCNAQRIYGNLVNWPIRQYKIELNFFVFRAVLKFLNRFVNVSHPINRSGVYGKDSSLYTRNRQQILD